MTKTNFRRIAFAVFIMIVLLPIQSWAQDAVSSYKVGQRVEYKDTYYSTVWHEGTVVSLNPRDEQVVIRWDPRADYPSYTHDGVSIYQQSYSMDSVRHIAQPVTQKPPVNNGGAGNDPVDPPVVGDGKGLMTKEEILGYMRTHGYVNGQPKYDQQVCRDLIEQIKRRGVKEPFKYGIDDLEPIVKNGCSSPKDDVVGTANYNLGTPTTPNWLFGTWSVSVSGGILKTAPGDGFLYTTNAVEAQAGFLTINGNGTYNWKVAGDPPANINGTWRNATKKEMGRQGGAGIVLLKGEAGSDWIAFKLMDPNMRHKEDRIEVEGLLEGGSYSRHGPRR